MNSKQESKNLSRTGTFEYRVVWSLCLMTVLPAIVVTWVLSWVLPREWCQWSDGVASSESRRPTILDRAISTVDSFMPYIHRV